MHRHYQHGLHFGPPIAFQSKTGSFWLAWRSHVESIPVTWVAWRAPSLAPTAIRLSCRRRAIHVRMVSALLILWTHEQPGRFKKNARASQLSHARLRPVPGPAEIELLRRAAVHVSVIDPIGFHPAPPVGAPPESQYLRDKRLLRLIIDDDKGRENPPPQDTGASHRETKFPISDIGRAAQDPVARGMDHPLVRQDQVPERFRVAMQLVRGNSFEVRQVMPSVRSEVRGYSKADGGECTIATGPAPFAECRQGGHAPGAQRVQP